MYWPEKCAAVIPCFNEAAQVAVVVAGVRQHLETVVVVDDGSTDGTGPCATGAGAEVLRHQINQGKGSAINSGLQFARSHGFTWALLMDGDGQHVSEDIPAFLQAAKSGEVQLVVGNRMNDTRSMPLLRRWVNRWMSQRLSNLTGQSLPDTQCGFRLIHLETWASLALKTSGFEVESEMLVAFLAAGHGVGFVPVCTVYKDEHSKIHPVRDTLRWLRWWRATRHAWRNRPAAH